MFLRITDMSGQCRGASAFYRGLLDICAEHFQTLYASMHLCNAAESLDENVVSGDSSQEVWERLTHAIMLESQSSGVALAKLYDIDGTTTRIAVVAVPLRDERQYHGAIALIVNCCDRAHGESLLCELRSLTALASSLASAIRALTSRLVRGRTPCSGL